jgi:hypothetical protein
MRIWRCLGAAALALALVAGLGWLNRHGIRHTLARWTGEEVLWEQVKGTVALGLLRLRYGAPRTDPYLPMAHVGLPPYGVNTFLEQEVEEKKVERSLQMISQAGFSWIRQEFPWEDIEISAKGDFWDHQWNRSAWDKYDRIVALAEQYDLQIIARLDNPPAWSRAVGNAPGWSMAPPDDYADFGDFVYAVVSRYRGRIRYYQIWNEPNIFPEWGDQPADPEGYVELLKIAYRRAKEADPDCVIVAAGLAQTTENTPPEFGPRNVSDLIYLERMYQAGVQGHFDIMGAMVYGLWSGPYDRRASPDRTNFSRAQLIREIMVRWGDGDKPVWATEVGWNALPPDFDAFPNFGRVTLDQQAAYAVEAYQRAAREWPWMGVMNYWFFRRPSDAEQDQTWYYFRMVEPDFTPLPAYAALAALAQTPPAVQIGFFQEDHWALDYQGPWQAEPDAEAVLGAVRRGGAGARLTFDFEGTALDLVLRDADATGHVQVAVDGQPRTLRRLTVAPHTESPAVAVVRGLRDGRHRVELDVLRDGFALDGLVVRREARRWPLLGGAGLILLALGAGLARARRRSKRR